MFSQNTKLREVYGVIGLYLWTNNVGRSLFGGCTKLQRVRIYGLGTNISFENSPDLTPESVAWMIEKCRANKTFTIKLHATAYAAAMADSSVTSALSSHTNVTLASA